MSARAFAVGWACILGMALYATVATAGHAVGVVRDRLSG
jgi:hypothetical protein